MPRERSGTLATMASKAKEIMPTSIAGHEVHRTSTLGLQGRPLRWMITACAVTGFSLFGYDQGLMSGLVDGDEFAHKEFPVLSTASNASVLQGGVTSSYEIGCFFGALWVLAFGERVGRKPIIILGCFIIVIGTIISITAFGDHWGLGQFVVGRVITGVGNGMNTATIPVWQSEMARPERRGTLVQFEGCVVAVGTCIAYWIDFGMSYVNSSAQWRFPVAMQILFALVVMILVLGLPESPKWLVAHDRFEDARPIYAALEQVTMEDPTVEERLASARDEVIRMGTAMRFGDLLTNGRTQHFSRMLIGASTQFFQQITGCNAAIYYSTVLFTRMQLGERMSLIMGGVFASVYALSTLPAFWLVDGIGRRNLFLVGAIGQGCSFLITMGCLTQVPASTDVVLTDEQKQIVKGAAVGLYLFIFFFAFSILGLPWIYPPEINPLKTRTAATAVSTCTNWLMNFAVVMFTPVFVANTGWGAYLFFALMNFIWVPVIFFFYPETAGRSLEEVDIIFARAHAEGRPAWRVAATMPKLSGAEVNEEADRLGINFNDEEGGIASISEPIKEVEEPAESSQSPSFEEKAKQDIPEAYHGAKSRSSSISQLSGQP